LAVDQLDLSIARGECFGLLGPNGAGKTTTIEILEGLTTPDSGIVEVLGRRWGTTDDREIRQRMGVQLQDNQIADKLTVWEVLVLFRSLYRDGRDPAEVVEWFELGAKKNVRFHKLSGGQKQRLNLACALVSRPEILFLDEPTTGLDPQARLKVWQIVEQYKAEGGTVLITTHYLEEAEKLCDRVAIMDRGRVIALGSPAQLIESLGTEQIVELEFEQAAPQGESWQLGPFELKRRVNGWCFQTDDVTERLPSLLQTIKSEGLGLKALRTHEPTLDDVFLALTGKALRDD
jgi:ABC-2 type transport system ATP-binding protein